MKKMGFWVIMILVLVFGIGMTAKAASLREENRGFSKEQYHIMEEEYINEIRLILLEKGCKNAGIALTYTTDAEGNRNYTVTLHHNRLDKLKTTEASLLYDRLQESAEKILFAEVSMKRL